MRQYVATALLGLFAMPLYAGTPVPPDLLDSVREIVANEMRASGTPAISVSVVANGQVVAVHAAGYADVEQGVAATPETVFQVASLSKLLTATVVMHEVEEGQLDLDRPVNHLLPAARQVRDVHGDPVPVTMRQLLSHSSGIAFGTPPRSGADASPRTLDEHLAAGLVTIRPPGEKIIYAGSGFALAGWLAAKVNETTFEALVANAVFDPLRMTRSSFKDPRTMGGELAAVYEGDGRIPHAGSSAGAPSGGLLTTSQDLARFMLFCLSRGELEGSRVLRGESIDAMLTLTQRMHPRVPEGIGLGFGVREIPGRKFVWWDGQLPGVASRLALLPEHGVGVTVLANRADNNAVIRISNRILELLVPPSPQPRLTGAIEAEEQSKLVGHYRIAGMFPPPRSLIERFANVAIAEADGTLQLSSMLTSEPSDLIPIGQGLFQTSEGGLGIVDGDRLFYSVIEGHRVGMLQGATAWFIYVGATLLVFLSLIGWGGYRLFRRRRTSR